MPLKIVQIATVPASNDSAPRLVVLTEDGRMFQTKQDLNLHQVEWFGDKWISITPPKDK